MQKKEEIILLVDPLHSEYCLKLSFFLNGHKPIVKTTHRDAFEFFINNHFDISLVLLFHSPDFPCNDFLRYLKLIEPSIPVLVLTEHSCEKFAASIFKLGASGYFKKSRQPYELKVSISNMLNFKPTEKIRQRYTIYGIYKAIEFINQNFCKNLKLYAAAKEAGMSIAAFERTFKKIVGANFSNYISKMRIAKSVDMLKKTNYPISDIAVACGYLNQSHFNKTFKKIIKISPRKFKKNFVKT